MYIMKKIQGKSILVRVCARFELSGVDCNKGVMLNIPSQYTVHALYLCHSFLESLLCHCLRARDHCCVLCDVTRDLLFTYTCQLSRLRRESHACGLKTSISRRLTPDWKMWVVAVLLETISKNMLSQTHVRNENHV